MGNIEKEWDTLTAIMKLIEDQVELEEENQFLKDFVAQKETRIKALNDAAVLDELELDDLKKLIEKVDGEELEGVGDAVEIKSRIETIEQTTAQNKLDIQVLVMQLETMKSCQKEGEDKLKKYRDRLQSVVSELSETSVLIRTVLIPLPVQNM